MMLLIGMVQRVIYIFDYTISCSRQSTQRAWFAGTGAQGGACDTHTLAIHCREALSVRSSLSLHCGCSGHSKRLPKLFLLPKIQAYGASSVYPISLESQKITSCENIKGICMVYEWYMIGISTRCAVIEQCALGSPTIGASDSEGHCLPATLCLV